MKIQIDEDCGNAPKKATIRDFLIVLARGQHKEVCSYVTDNIQWELAGGDVVTGREHVADLVGQLTCGSAISFTVTDILSHGDRCAACGTFRHADGSQTSVAHFFRFNGHAKNAKISRVITYTTDSHSSGTSASS